MIYKYSKLVFIIFILSGYFSVCTAENISYKYYYCDNIFLCKKSKIPVDLNGIIETLVRAVLQDDLYSIWMLDPETKNLAFSGELNEHKNKHLFSKTKLKYGYSVKSILQKNKTISIAVQDQTSISGDRVAQVYFFPKNELKITLPLTAKMCRNWHNTFVTTKFKLTNEGWVLMTLFDDETELC